MKLRCSQIVETIYPERQVISLRSPSGSLDAVDLQVTVNAPHCFEVGHEYDLELRDRGRIVLLRGTV